MANLLPFGTLQTIKTISTNQENLYNSLMPEVERADLQPLLGMKFYQDIIQNPSEERYTDLLNGKDWTDSDGFKYQMKGLNYVIAYLFYARYIVQSSLKDTFSGLVEHNFNESDLADQRAKEKLAKQAREVASQYWEECILFLNYYASTYEYWLSSDKTPWKPKIRRLDQIDTSDSERCPDTGKRYIT